MPVEEDAKRLLATLLEADETGSRRQAAAVSLQASFRSRSNTAYAKQMFAQLMYMLEPLLADSVGLVRQEMPKLIAALCAAQQPEMHGFCSWFMCATAVNHQPSTQSQLVLVLHHLLLLLLDDGAESIILPFLPELITSIRTVLNSTDDPTHLSPIITLLVTLRRAGRMHSSRERDTCVHMHQLRPSPIG